MYPNLSQFLAAELEVLSFCLETNIAQEIEEILVKIAQKELKADKAFVQITKIIKNQNLKIESENPSDVQKLEMETQKNLTNLDSKSSNSDQKSQPKTRKIDIENSSNQEKNPKKLKINQKIKILETDKIETQKIETDFTKKTTNLNQVENKEIGSQLLKENFSLDLEIESAKDLATASLRAPVGYHLPNAMKKMNEQNPLLAKFGGHPCAAGFSAKTHNLEQIKKNLSLEISAQKTLETQKKSFVNPTFEGKISSFLKNKTSQKNLIWLNLKELNLQLLREVCQLEPFGQDFAMPNFIFQIPLVNSKLQGKRYFNEFAANRQKKLGPLYFWLGKEQKHIKIEIADLKITVFGIDSFLKEKLNNPKDEIISLWLECRISQNTWQQKTTLELLCQELWME